MNDQNRYEEVPQKESGFKKAMAGLGHYFKTVFLDFIQSFKYNNMKLAAILVALPGIFLGFFLRFHAEVVTHITYELPDKTLYNMPFDFTGLVLFLLMLFGILNIFGAVTMSGKKNLGSVIVCTISTAVIVISGALYLYALFTFLGGYDNGAGVIKTSTPITVDSNWYLSMASVIIAMVTSVAGCVLGFINYDRTYEKVDR
jgi:phosphate/sulfate permease